MDSETDFPSDSNCDEVANEIPFVGNILQLFQFEPFFTTAELYCKIDQLLHHRTWFAGSSLGGIHGQKLKNGCTY